MKILAVFFAFSYGVIVEISQAVFTQCNMQADIMDVVFNTLGSIAAIFLVGLIQKIKK